MKPTATIIAAAVFAFGASAASASLPVHQIAPLTLRIKTGQSQSRCTRPIPASAPPVAIWVYANGQQIHSTSSGGWTDYYAGNGTLVKVRSYPGDGPICAKATTWLPHARVRVKFRVLRG